MFSKCFKTEVCCIFRHRKHKYKRITVWLISISPLFLFRLLNIEPRTFHTLEKHFTTELHIQYFSNVFFVSFWLSSYNVILITFNPLDPSLTLPTQHFIPPSFSLREYSCYCQYILGCMPFQQNMDHPSGSIPLKEIYSSSHIFPLLPIAT